MRTVLIATVVAIASGMAIALGLMALLALVVRWLGGRQPTGDDAPRLD